ncbi:SAM-dependent MidA family methyltransferase [Rhodoligotrophos appendicifer]|uniref:class I SAM-dependent methyltransferase n=1 Tax=Rhodoligotrophos appendicifer TaxID=987056 RepID=UPI001186085D|nr:SAM-dependent methyltransferase [Rhodoligotrophos appendicifer]
MSTPTRLEELIRHRIEVDGPLPLDRYMELCLSHPTLGYYMHGEPIGVGGDFITAPEISQMFGELIGIWCANVWQMMGSPELLRLVELGPGRGTLMADIARIAERVPGFAESVRLHLVETSPTLIQIQQERLAGKGAQWHPAVDAVPEGPCIILANEFFDALPIRQFEWRHDGWSERGVGVKADGTLGFGLIPHSAPPPSWALPAGPREDGTILEVSEIQTTLAGQVGAHIQAHGGALLIIDYGYVEVAYGDSLQALRMHRSVSPLEDPGDCDLTAHVSFASLARALRQTGVKVSRALTQAQFLNALGLTLRAERLKGSANERQRAMIDSAAARLTASGPTGMGELFKVLAAWHPSLPALVPFTSEAL